MTNLEPSILSQLQQYRNYLYKFSTGKGMQLGKKSVQNSLFEKIKSDEKLLDMPAPQIQSRPYVSSEASEPSVPQTNDKRFYMTKKVFKFLLKKKFRLWLVETGDCKVWKLTEQ
jgi:hypothetical protein